MLLTYSLRQALYNAPIMNHEVHGGIGPYDDETERLVQQQAGLYFEISSLFFQTFQNPAAIEQASMANGGYISLSLHRPGRAVPDLTILRHHARLQDGGWSIVDIVTVDKTQLSSSSPSEITLPFEIDIQGNLTKMSYVGPGNLAPYLTRRHLYFEAALQAITVGSATPNTTVYVDNQPVLRSDGENWQSYTS